jgi:hypothetical protein
MTVNFNDFSTDNEAAEPSAEAMTGGGAEQFGDPSDGTFEATSGGRTGLKINSGALVLGLVIVVAVIGLYSMRTLTRATAATGSRSDLEQSIETFLNTISGGRVGVAAGTTNQGAADETVLDVLSESYIERQVSLENVQRNPFIIFEEKPAEQPAKKPAVDPRIQLRRLRQEAFEQASGRLRLRSVLMGREPLATIDQRVVRIGDTVTAMPENVEFRVTAIAPDTVTLVAEDAELDLTVELSLHLRR